jgi:hypothetical protein
MSFYANWATRNLKNVRHGKDKWIEASCPLHDDRKPSLRLDGDGGGYCCNSSKCPSPKGHIAQLAAFAGLEAPPKLEFTSRPANLEKVDDYIYHALDGSEFGKVSRFWDHQTGTKTFRQYRKDGAEFKSGGGDRPWPLFEAHKLQGEPPGTLVLWVEGEKVVRAAQKLGFHATTSAGGCNGLGRLDRQSLAVLEGKRVVILPDNDQPGLKYAQEVLGLLRLHNQEVAQ